jgi:hypothetical protein
MSAVANTQELKGLQVRLAKEQANNKLLREEASAAQRKLSQSGSAIKDLEGRIAALQSEAPAPIVSEHALLQYLVRHKGLDTEALKQELLGDGTAKAIAFARSGSIKKGPVTLVVKDNVVVTVT